MSYCYYSLDYIHLLIYNYNAFIYFHNAISVDAPREHKADIEQQYHTCRYTYKKCADKEISARVRVNLNFQR